MDGLIQKRVTFKYIVTRKVSYLLEVVAVEGRSSRRYIFFSSG